MTGAPLLDVRDLARHYQVRGRPPLRAVDGVSFTMSPATIFGIVGESGCGKSTLANLVMALDRPSAGQVRFDGRDLFVASARDLRALRRGFQMVFQDPYGSLDPRQSVGRIVAEPLHLERLEAGERRDRVLAALASVGLAAEDANRLPHSFSGGQRQRIALARAIVGRPRLVVADEPVSALDLSIQAQILNLVLDLRDRDGLAFLFISHALAVVEAIADRIAVMLHGRFVETGEAAAVLRTPLHPYTMALVQAEPRLGRADGPGRRRPAGATRQQVDPESSCSYVGQCPFAIERCAHETPRLRPVDLGRFAACHRAETIAT